MILSATFTFRFTFSVSNKAIIIQFITKNIIRKQFIELTTFPKTTMLALIIKINQQETIKYSITAQHNDNSLAHHTP